MNRAFHSLSLLLILAQSIAALAAYPLMPRQIDVNLFGEVYAFGHPVKLNPRMADKARIFALPAVALAMQAYFWFSPRASRWLFPRASRSRFWPAPIPSSSIPLITGVLAYAQCLAVSSAFYGPTNLACYVIFVVWFCLVGSSPLIPASFRYLAANWMMLRGRPVGQILDVPSSSVSTSMNERTWIDRHPMIASFLALAALIVFVLCMAIGLPFVFTVAFTIALAISVATVFHSWMCGSATSGAANSHAQAAQ